MKRRPDGTARTAEHERRTDSLDDPGAVNKAVTIVALAVGAAAVSIEPVVAVAALVVTAGLTAVAALPFVAVVAAYRARPLRR